MNIVFKLPFPVSLNGATANLKGGGRCKTQEAKTWLKSASMAAQSILSKYRQICDNNIFERFNARTGKKGKKPNLHRLHKDNPNLKYTVRYVFYYPTTQQKKPRDGANYEKILTDFLVDIGLLLDDSFITTYLLHVGGVDEKNPRVEIKIKKVN